MSEPQQPGPVMHAFEIATLMRDYAVGDLDIPRLRRDFDPIRQALLDSRQRTGRTTATLGEVQADFGTPAYPPWALPFAELTRTLVRRPELAGTWLARVELQADVSAAVAEKLQLIRNTAQQLSAAVSSLAKDDTLLAFDADLTALSHVPAPPSLDDLFAALQRLEVMVHRLISVELQRVARDVPLIQQQEQLRRIRTHGALLAACYLAIVRNKRIMTQVVRIVGPVAERITLMRQGMRQAHEHLPPGAERVPPPPDVRSWRLANLVTGRIDPTSPVTADRTSGEYKEFRLLCLVRRLVLLSLAVASTSPENAAARADAPRPGRTLIDRLTNAPSFAVRLSVAGSSLPTTFFAGPLDTAAVMRDEQSPGVGSPSSIQFGVPVPVDIEAEATSPFDSLRTYLGQTSVDSHFQTLALGSLSFDGQDRAFYTPGRFEILHELVHTLHNAQGSNRANWTMSNAERMIWSNHEEYFTITDVPVGENAMYAELHLPQRRGHTGVPIAKVDDEETFGRATLDEVARGH